jgi:hypothetical protein
LIRQHGCSVTVGLGLLFSEKKLFCETRNRRKFLFILSEFRLLHLMEKANKFPSSHSTEDEIAQNSIANNFVEEKKTLNFTILFRTISRKTKMLGIPFRTISQKRKPLRISFLAIKQKEKLLDHPRTKKKHSDDLKKKTFFHITVFVPFHSEPWKLE